jgi:hypothetical protein
MFTLNIRKQDLTNVISDQTQLMPCYSMVNNKSEMVINTVKCPILPCSLEKASSLRLSEGISKYQQLKKKSATTALKIVLA